MLREYLESTTERTLRALFFWTSSDDEFGHMVIVFHYWVWGFLIGSYISMRFCKLPPVFVYGLFFILSAIWAHHITLGVCLLSSIQKRVLGRECEMVTPVLRQFNIPVTDEVVSGTMVLFSSLFLLLMFIEVLIAK